ncbi:MAG: hypothetical protein ACK4QL_04960 [Pseudanabaenaceae cyanobacterium]
MDNISFETAIARTELLLTEYQEQKLTPEALQKAVTALLTTSNGARGFFVTFLTGGWQLADQPSAEIMAALDTAPTPSAELMVKNLVMSTGMAITHTRQGDLQQANQSRLVAQRSLNILTQWQSPLVQQIARAMYASATQGIGEYTEFLRKWGYDQEQLTAIAQALQPLI